nr:MAG TPA: hypothetical protein [Caudoviricetes sp.]
MTSNGGNIALGIISILSGLSILPSASTKGLSTLGYFIYLSLIILITLIDEFPSVK